MDFLKNFKKNVNHALSQMAQKAEETVKAQTTLNGVPNTLGEFGPESHPHHLEDYLQRFDAMVAKLKAHPNIVVLGYNTFAPVEANAIAEYERELGFELPKDLKTFYQQTDGLQLRWITRDNDEFDEEEHVWEDAPVEWNWSLLNNWPADGVVMIQPLWDLLNEYGEGTYYTEGQQDPDWQEVYLGEKIPYGEFRRNLRLFDFFANETDMTLYLNPKGPSTLIIGHDSQASFDMTAFVDIGTYLEFLIARMGRQYDRHNYFFRSSNSESVWKYAPKSFWDGETIDLDSL